MRVCVRAYVRVYTSPGPSSACEIHGRRRSLMSWCVGMRLSRVSMRTFALAYVRTSIGAVHACVFTLCALGGAAACKRVAYERDASRLARLIVCEY